MWYSWYNSFKEETERGKTMLACLTLDSVQQEKVEDVLQHLREKSVRITETRRAVLSYLVKSQEHPSADAIYQDLKPAFPKYEPGNRL